MTKREENRIKAKIEEYRLGIKYNIGKINYAKHVIEDYGKNITSNERKIDSLMKANARKTERIKELKKLLESA